MTARPRVAVVVMACVIMVLSVPTLAYAATWMSQYPAGTIHVQPSIVTVDVFSTAKLQPATAVMTIAGVAQATFLTNVGPASGHWAATETQNPTTGIWTVTWKWVADTGGTTKATLYCYPATLSEGTKAVTVTVKDISGTTLTYAWTFTISIPPVIGVPTPAAGSIITTLTPAISVPVSDNTGVTSWTATISGVPATASLAGGILRIVPGAPLTNDATATVSLAVFDAAGNSASRSWSYYVQTYVPMPGDYSNCISCHPTDATAKDMGPNCLLCHTATSGYAAHTGTASSLHTRAALSTDCTGCHVSDLLSEHDRYGLTCLTCHTSTDAGVQAAIASGDSRCTSCHDDLSGGHLAVHGTLVGSMLLAGTTATCGDCHSANLMTEHAKPTSSSAPAGCAACHPSPRSTIVVFDPTSCVQAGCHIAGTSAAMHASIVASHTVPADSGCMGADCHSGDLASIHANATTTTAGVTRTSCLVCHSSTALPASGN
jgi:hypothetical protein